MTISRERSTSRVNLKRSNIFLFQSYDEMYL